MTFERYYLFHRRTKVPLADMRQAHAREICGGGLPGNPYRVHCRCGLWKASGEGFGDDAYAEFAEHLAAMEREWHEDAAEALLHA